MRYFYAWFTGLTLALVLLLTACGDARATTPAGDTTDEAAVPAGDTADEAAVAASPEPTLAPSDTPAPAEPSDPPATPTVVPSEPTVPAAADAPQFPITVTDIDGNDVMVESAERIVALNGDITEIVVALGLGEQLVGVDLSATYPPDLVDALPKIGYQYNLNAEGILSLDPTVVIGKEGAGPPEVLQQIRNAGIPVVIGTDNQGIAAPAEKIRFVAAALGIPAVGEQLVTDLEADLETARSLLAETESPAPRVLFLYLRGTSTQAVAGSDTAADAMITAAGGINVGAEQGIDGYEQLSPEVVAAVQPEVILLMESGLDSMGGVEGLFTIPGLADTPAAQEQRVITMDGLYLIGLGPRTGEAVRDLSLQLYPELEARSE